jgi:hypothetical protein
MHSFDSTNPGQQGFRNDPQRTVSVATFRLSTNGHAIGFMRSQESREPPLCIF